MVRGVMDPEMALFTICLYFFQWLALILDAKTLIWTRYDRRFGSGVAEIAAGLEQVVRLLSELPEWLRDEVKEYIPQFHINQQGPSWIQPLIEHWLGNVDENLHSNMATSVARDTAGRFITDATTPKEEI